MNETSKLKLVEEEQPEYRISIVPVEDCMLMWKTVAPLLEPAVERSEGRWTMAHLLAELCMGRQSLWIAYDETGEIKAAATTHMAVYPNRKMLVLKFLGGTDFATWFKSGFDIMCSFAKSCECEGIETFGRFGFWKQLQKAGWSRDCAAYSYTFKED